MWVRVGAIVLLLLFAFEANAHTHLLQVRVDENLQQVFVKAEFTGYVDTLRSGSGQSIRTLRNPRSCDGTPLRARWGRLQVRERNACIRYTFPLEFTAPFARYNYTPPDGVEITAPEDWLWLPSSIAQPVRVKFNLPQDMQVSVPWEPLDDRTYQFGDSPGSGQALVVFGDFTQRELKVPGATLRVAVLPGVDTRKMMRWLWATSMDVALVDEEFPNPSPQVLVIPVRSDPNRGAIPFGRVVRDGGESVHFFVNTAKPLEAYTHDWTATHEFSHLLIPFVHSDEKWVSEGMASYYQNVLLGRAGVYSEKDAWQRLHRSFMRAKETGGDMSPNGTAEEKFWEARMMIYWSGAAMALLADVELRKQGKSLDEVLGALRECCLPSDKIWRAPELFAKLDELSDTNIFSALYRRHANSPGIPDLTQLYADLGIVPNGKRVVLSNNAEYVRLRKDIMGQRATATQLRQ